MAFGKRGQAAHSDQRRTSVTASPLETASPEVASAPRQSVLKNQFSRIAIGVALALGFIALDRLALQSVTTNFDARWEARTAPIAWSTIVPAPFKNSTAIEQRLANSCLKLLDVTRHSGTTDEGAFAWSLGRGEMAQMLAAGEYLACSIESAPDLLCSANQRAKVLADIRTFLGYRKTVLRRNDEERILNAGHPMRQKMDRQRGQVASEDAAPISDGTLERIASALHKSVESGYFPARDLNQLRSTELSQAITPLLTMTSTERPCQ